MDANDRADILSLVERVICQTTIPPPVYPPPSRFKKFGGYYVCERCRLVQEFCGCAKAPPSPSPPTQDGAESDLNRRIRDVKGTP